MAEKAEWGVARSVAWELILQPTHLDGFGNRDLGPVRLGPSSLNHFGKPYLLLQRSITFPNSPPTVDRVFKHRRLLGALHILPITLHKKHLSNDCWLWVGESHKLPPVDEMLEAIDYC